MVILTGLNLFLNKLLESLSLFSHNYFEFRLHFDIRWKVQVFQQNFLSQTASLAKPIEEKLNEKLNAHFSSGFRTQPRLLPTSTKLINTLGIHTNTSIQLNGCLLLR